MNRLRELRLARGLKQHQVGAWIGRDSSMVDRYERGESDPPLPILRILASRFGVSVEFLMGWDYSDDPDLQPAA